MKRARMRRDAERSVLSIAIALEQAAQRAPTVQEDLFGGAIALEPNAYSSYYADLARRVCVRELAVRS